MKNASITTKRCVIYTRKSTDHNLDLAFNLLDAQREAYEVYIESQAHEGWKLVAGKYDDGAFSGASLDRPALQDLLDQVRANKIDIVAEMQSRDLTAGPMQVGEVSIKKVVVKHDRVEVIINKESGADLMTVSHPYVASASARKGILNQNKKIADDPAQRLALLKAIALARKWMALILKGSGDIHTLAGEGNLTERHFRYLLSLAYLSPKVITAIADGTAPASWTASNIARNLPLRWSEQERLLQAE